MALDRREELILSYEIGQMAKVVCLHMQSDKRWADAQRLAFCESIFHQRNVVIECVAVKTDFKPYRSMRSRMTWSERNGVDLIGNVDTSRERRLSNCAGLSVSLSFDSCSVVSLAKDETMDRLLDDVRFAEGQVLLGYAFEIEPSMAPWQYLVGVCGSGEMPQADAIRIGVWSRNLAALGAGKFFREIYPINLFQHEKITLGKKVLERWIEQEKAGTLEFSAAFNCWVWTVEESDRALISKELDRFGIIGAARKLV